MCAIYLYIYLPITLLWIFITQCFDPSYICVSKRFSLTKQKARYKKLMDEMGKNGFKRNFGEKDFQERGIYTFKSKDFLTFFKASIWLITMQTNISYIFFYPGNRTGTFICNRTAARQLRFKPLLHPGLVVKVLFWL